MRFASPAPLPPPFRCETHRDGGRARVRPIGELDIATVPEVDRQLRSLSEAGDLDLVLDLRDVSFMDSSGLRLILAWRERAAGDDGDFSIIPGSEVVERVFETTRVRDLLTFTEPPPDP
jgi:anti-sigma B factor antagonist